jgi:SAM-dependent methyltransferase
MNVPEDNKQSPAYNGDDLLWRHLKTVPAFRALLRAVEARFYRQIHIPQPILDLGCGDGHFARMAFEQRLAAGVDPWWGPLQKARQSGAYRLNVQALGHALPFADETFAGVVSNSVLEHIPQVQPVLAEANRVLRPGGTLVVTMPSHHFTRHLAGARLLAPVGLDDAYRRFFNFISRHAHTDPPQQWAQRLAAAGFGIRRWHYYFSRRALRALEIGHVQGLPSALLHALTGHWILGPWRGNLRLTERWVRPFYEEVLPEEGAYLFIVAQKVDDGPVSAQLPAARPLSVEEPEPAAPAPEAAVVGEERKEAAAPQPAEVEAAPAPAPEPAPASGRAASGMVSMGLLVLGLLLAAIGQSILVSRPLSPSGGLTAYALAWLALGGGALYLQRRRPDREGQVSNVRHLTYPLALLLALLAKDQAGGTAFEGNPLAALLLWFLAIATAFYALRRPHGAQSEGQSGHEGPDDAAVASEEAPSGGPARRARPLLLPLGLFLVGLLPRLLALTEHPFMLNGIEASIGLDAQAVLQGQIGNPFATAWLTNPTLPLYFTAAPLAVLGQTVLGIRILSALVGALTVPVLYLLAGRLWNRRLALAAALLLAGYHLHLHYSRLGMTNVWDPLLVLLVLGLIGLAHKRPSRRRWLLAGLATGLSAYFYTPSHLVPLMLPAIAVYFFLFERPTLAQWWPDMLAGAAMALVVALPQLMYYRAHPGLFMERANSLGILHTDWLVQQASATGRPPLTLLAEQFWQAALAFHSTLDTTSTYNPGIPLLRFWPSLFFTVGLGVALAHVRRLHQALLLIWLSVTFLFASFLQLDAPDSHRLLVAAPAVALLVASGLFWVGRHLHRAWQRFAGRVPAGERDGRRPRMLLAALFLVVAVFVAGDLLFYFGTYRNSNRYGDRNTEVAYEMGRYLRSLEGEWTAYFHGAPAMYVSFPTISYLAADFRPGANLFDVTEPDAPLPGQPGAGNLLFIYLPERSGEAQATRGQYPGGTLHTVEGRLADPLFYAYEVRR